MRHEPAGNSVISDEPLKINDHEHFHMLMSLALDNELDPVADGALQRHLQGCIDCRERWTLWQMLDVNFEAAPLVEPPPHLLSSVMVALAAAEQRNSRRVWFSLLFLSATVWLFALVGMGAFMAMLYYYGSQWMNDTFLTLEPLWTALVILGRNARTAFVGVAANPLSLSALILYLLFALFTLTGWTRYLRQSTQPITTK